MRNDQLPAELRDPAVCRFMGWSYDELLEAPDQMVDDIRTWMDKAALIMKEKGSRGR